jgi:hypothetical protein
MVKKKKKFKSKRIKILQFNKIIKKDEEDILNLKIIFYLDILKINFTANFYFNQ